MGACIHCPRRRCSASRRRRRRWRYSLLDWRARARVAVEPLIPARRVADESVASFFRRRFGAATVGLIAEPLLGGIHAGDVEQLSMPSLFPRFTAAEHQRGGVLRATSSPAAPDGLFRALRGGMAELVDAIVHKLPPGAMRLDTPVSAIGRTPGGWTVTAGRDVLDAASVIVAAPAPRGFDTAAARGRQRVAHLCDACPTSRP